MEPVRGIEPLFPDYKTGVLPLQLHRQKVELPLLLFLGGQSWHEWPLCYVMVQPQILLLRYALVPSQSSLHSTQYQ